MLTALVVSILLIIAQNALLIGAGTCSPAIHPVLLEHILIPTLLTALPAVPTVKSV